MIGDVKTMSAVLIFDVLQLEFRHDAFGLIFQTQMALQFTKTISRSAMVELKERNLTLNFFLFFPFAVVTKEKFTPRSKVLAQDLVQRPNLREALHIPHKTAQADSGHLQSIPLEKRPLQEHLPPDEVRLGSCPGLAEGPAGFAGNSTLTHRVTNSRRGKSPTDPLMFYSFQEGCLLPLICSSSPNLLPL